MIYILEDITCDNLGLMETLYVFKTVMNIITIFVPILLILLSILKVITIMSSDDPSPGKAFKAISKKMIAAVVVFLLPSIINAVMSITDGIQLTNTSCYQEATKENIEQKRQEVMQKDAEIDS